VCGTLRRAAFIRAKRTHPCATAHAGHAKTFPPTLGCSLEYARKERQKATPPPPPHRSPQQTRRNSNKPVGSTWFPWDALRIGRTRAHGRRQVVHTAGCVVVVVEAASKCMPVAATRHVRGRQAATVLSSGEGRRTLACRRTSDCVPARRAAGAVGAAERECGKRVEDGRRCRRTCRSGSPLPASVERSQCTGTERGAHAHPHTHTRASVQRRKDRRTPHTQTLTCGCAHTLRPACTNALMDACPPARTHFRTHARPHRQFQPTETHASRRTLIDMVPIGMLYESGAPAHTGRAKSLPPPLASLL
jgi:hypothetical protein